MIDRKRQLDPPEILEATVRGGNTCAAIACETDYEPPCLRGECHPQHCLIIANEAAMMAQMHEHEHEAQQKDETEPRHRGTYGRTHGTTRLTTSAGEFNIPEPQHSRASIELVEDAEMRSARYLMRIFELGSGFRYVRRGSRMRHLGNGGFMAIKKYS